MGDARNARRRLRGLPSPGTSIAVTRGAFPLGGSRGTVRVEFPADLDAQGKYDAATAFAQAAQKLVAEADAATGAVPPPPVDSWIAAREARIDAFTLDDLRKHVNVASNTRGADRWTAREWLYLFDAFRRCGWDFTPDVWAYWQIEQALADGTIPRWDDDERALGDPEVP